MKEKNKIAYEKTNKHLNEVICVFIMISIYIIITEIGEVGLLLKIICKIILGDLYFVILLFSFLSSFLIVLQHEIKYKSQPFIGFILTYLFLSSLMHLAIDKYFNYENSIVNSFYMYLGYLENYQQNFLFGGGIISSIVNQFLYSILGKNGTIFILMCLLFFAIFLMFNLSLNNIVEFYHVSKMKLTNTYDKCVNILSKIPYKVENKTNTYKISYLKEYPKINKIINEEYANDLTSYLLIFLDNIGLEYTISDKKIGYNYFLLEISFNGELANEVIKKTYQYLNNECFILKNKTTLKLYIENKEECSLGLKSILIRKKNLIPLGRFLNDSISYYETGNLLFIGDNITGFLLSFITSILLIKKISPTIYDLKRNLHFLNGKKIKYKTIFNIKDLLNQLDTDIDLLEESYIIINCLDNIKKQAMYEDLQYLLRFSRNTKMHFIVINETFSKEDINLYSLFKLKMLGKVCDNLTSNLLLKNTQAVYLKKEASLMIQESQIKFIEIPYVSLEEYKKIVR